ncbi:MAG: hypothetical protein WC708_00400 [Lentisphaeria bacterium]|jgi:hypothetical protein
MPSLDEVFIIDGITRRQIIEDISDLLGTEINLNDPSITREMCVELANELGCTDESQREEKYKILLGRIANESGVHLEAMSLKEK